MIHNDITLIAMLAAAAPYVQRAHDEAAAKHDSYGEFYMDDGQYKIITDARVLLARLAEVLEC